MYQKILVPLDGSQRAETILPHVEELARRCNSQVIFLQVVHPVVVSDGYKGILIDQSEKESQQLIEDAGSYLSGIEGRFRDDGLSTTHLVEIGSVVETINKVAQQEDIGLIAMASHGRSGFSRVFYGSVAAGVLQSVDRPLLLIRSRAQ